MTKRRGRWDPAQSEPMPNWARYALALFFLAWCVYIAWPLLDALWAGARAAYYLGASVAQ